MIEEPPLLTTPPLDLSPPVFAAPPSDATPPVDFEPPVDTEPPEPLLPPVSRAPLEPPVLVEPPTLMLVPALVVHPAAATATPPLVAPPKVWTPPFEDAPPRKLAVPPFATKTPGSELLQPLETVAAKKKRPISIFRMGTSRGRERRGDGKQKTARSPMYVAHLALAHGGIANDRNGCFDLHECASASLGEDPNCRDVATVTLRRCIQGVSLNSPRRTSITIRTHWEQFQVAQNATVPSY